MVLPKNAGRGKNNTNLTTLRQSPLKPSMIWIVDAMMRAPCVPRIVRKNFFTSAIKARQCYWRNLCLKRLKHLSKRKKRDWNKGDGQNTATVPREGLLRCCTAQPRWSRWSVPQRYMSRPLPLEDESRRMFEAGCLCQLRIISSEPPELSLPDRNVIQYQVFGMHIVTWLIQCALILLHQHKKKYNCQSSAFST